MKDNGIVDENLETDLNSITNTKISDLRRARTDLKIRRQKSLPDMKISQINHHKKTTTVLEFDKKQINDTTNRLTLNPYKNKE